MRSTLYFLPVLVALTTTSVAGARTPVPRIVNGTATAGYASVGALLYYADPQRTQVDGLCSGTLVGCRTFVTAAHCLCDEFAEDADDCARFGLVDPSTIQIYLQHAGLFDVESAVIHPAYVFAEAADIAVLKLAQAPSGVAPSAINTLARPPLGTSGLLVGFGTTGGGPRSPDNAGVKREGPVTTTSCEPDVPGDVHICWRFNGQGSSTCSGDSGGPLFIDTVDGLVLAGTTSGGTAETCLAPDFSFDTDVFVYRSFVMEQAGEELGDVSCSDVPTVGSDDVAVVQRTGMLSGSAPEARFDFEVPVGTSELRVGLNGQLYGGNGPFLGWNQFNFYIRAGAPPTLTEFDCSDQDPSVFGFCQVAHPQSGTWHVLIRDAQGAGEWQVTATLIAEAAPVCAGDCDGDGHVTVDELVAGIDMALGGGAGACESLDIDDNGSVTVDEIVTAVSNALDGCG